MSNTEAAGRLRESKVRKALDILSASELVAHLDGVKWTEAAADDFIAIFRRSSALYFKYPSPKCETRRDELIAAVAAWVGAKGSPQQQATLQEAVDIFRTTEAGYRQILVSLDRSEAMALAPDRQLAAMLHRAVLQMEDVEVRHRRHMRSKSEIVRIHPARAAGSWL